MRKRLLLSGIAALVVITLLGTFMSDRDAKTTGDLGISPVTIFMCGDVMLGRGIDQVLPHPGDPTIHESFMKSALGYVEIAERMNGPIPRAAGYYYIWGADLEELDHMRPDLRIINFKW